MTKTLIDIDEELLAEAAIAFGTKTKKDTVNAALKEGVERKKRALALARPRRGPMRGTSTSCSSRRPTVDEYGRLPH